LVWFGLGWFGLVWAGLGWFGLIWFGLVWFGLSWVGLGWDEQTLPNNSMFWGALPNNSLFWGDSAKQLYVLGGLCQTTPCSSATLCFHIITTLYHTQSSSTYTSTAPFRVSIGVVVHQVALRMLGRGFYSPHGRPKCCRSLSTAMVACPVEVEDRSLPAYDGFP